MGLRNVCIVHKIEENSLASYYKNFVRWIGNFYLNFTVDEKNENMNEFIESGNNKFDFIVYLNDKSNEWEKRYNSHSDTNVSIQYSKEDDRNESKTRKNFLIQIWDKVFEKKQGVGYNSVKDIIKELVNIYSSEGVFALLEDNYDIIFPNYGSEYLRREYLIKRKSCWDEIIKQLKKSYREYSTCQGVEYLQYALVFSYQKMNEICKILGIKEVIKIKNLLAAAECIYTSDSDFCAVEYLKSRIVRDDFMQSGMSKYYIQHCIDGCDNDIVKSFLYYCLGKAYEKDNMIDEAYESYKESYRKNKNSFRAIYKLAIREKLRENYNESIIFLKKILEIFQIPILGDRENFEYLELLQVEYVCKCYVLIGRMENSVNAVAYYKEIVEISKQLGENEMFKLLYCNMEESDSISPNLGNILSMEYIENKIAYSQGLKEYQRWEKGNESRRESS